MDQVRTDMLLAVRASRVFDGERNAGAATVLIDDGKIIDVDTAAAAPPAQAQVLDLDSDVSLLPGLIDAHVHLAFDAGPDVVTALNAADDDALLAQMTRAAHRVVHAGITSVRDLGDRGFAALRLREQLSASSKPGPEIVASGPPITTPGGHCHFLGGVADGPQACLAAVRERAARRLRGREGDGQRRQPHGGQQAL